MSPRIPSPGELPLLRQLRGGDKLGRGAAVKSHRSEELRARTATADRIVKSVCPYCAVGCAQNVFVKDGEIVQIEGDPDAPAQSRPALPEGLGDQAAGHRLLARAPRPLPRAPAAPTGSGSTWRRRWT